MPNIEEHILDLEKKQLLEPKNQEEKFNKYLNYFPLPYVGVSILQAFESCPVSWYLTYYQDVKFPPNAKMQFGTIFQEALTAKYKKLNYNNILSKMDNLNKNKANYLIKKANEFKDIIYFDEYMFVDMNVGIPIRFAADLITKHEIVENKTTRGYYNEDMVSKQKQGSLYYGCIKKLLGLDLPVKYQLFNLQDRTCKLIELNKTDKDIEEVLNWVKDTLEKIKQCYKTGKWYTNEHTKYICDLKSACPIVNNV